jgi:hypothetical protein
MLAALFFWGIQRNELQAAVWMENTSWKDAVEDVKWILSELLGSGGASGSHQD